MQIAQLRNAPTDPQWKWLRKSTCERFGLVSHSVLWNQTTGQMILVCLKSKTGADYSLNDAALKQLVQLEDQGQIRQGYVGQINDEIDREELVAWDTAKNVKRKLNGVMPRDGQFGDYHFVTGGFGAGSGFDPVVLGASRINRTIHNTWSEAELNFGGFGRR